MDITQALKDTENSLRDFIAVILRAKLGESWLANSGISPERLQKWEERKESEQRRQDSGVVEQRLLYYADFYDLRTILKKHWAGEFASAFGDWKTMEVWLTELEKLRDPDAHRRELLPHQKNLILGIAGEIRTRLVRYRSKNETSEDYYPRIESARDNLGNIYSYGGMTVIDTGMRLRVGDTIDFVITATDPLGESLEYAIYEGEPKWQNDNVITYTLSEKNVRKNFAALLVIKSKRQFHAQRDHDDIVAFHYEVLPPK